MSVFQVSNRSLFEPLEAVEPVCYDIRELDVQDGCVFYTVAAAGRGP